MADLYLKALESERKQLWAVCRLKGLPRDTKERLRIADLDEQIAAHKAKVGAKAAAKPAGKKGPAVKKGGAKKPKGKKPKPQESKPQNSAAKTAAPSSGEA